MTRHISSILTTAHLQKCVQNAGMRTLNCSLMQQYSLHFDPELNFKIPLIHLQQLETTLP